MRGPSIPFAFFAWIDPSALSGWRPLIGLISRSVNESCSQWETILIDGSKFQSGRLKVQETCPFTGCVGPRVKQELEKEIQRRCCWTGSYFLCSSLS